MPRADKESTLARQWELMRLIPLRPPGRTVRELSEALEVAGYSVTKRTVERDLANLAGIFLSSAMRSPSPTAGIGNPGRSSRSPAWT